MIRCSTGTRYLPILMLYLFPSYCSSTPSNFWVLSSPCFVARGNVLCSRNYHPRSFHITGKKNTRTLVLVSVQFVSSCENVAVLIRIRFGYFHILCLGSSDQVLKAHGIGSKRRAHSRLSRFGLSHFLLWFKNLCFMLWGKIAAGENSVLPPPPRRKDYFVQRFRSL